MADQVPTDRQERRRSEREELLEHVQDVGLPPLPAETEAASTHRHPCSGVASVRALRRAAAEHDIAELLHRAEERDLRAERRDRAAEQRDGVPDRDGSRAAEDRQQSALDRVRAGADRDASAMDRADLINSLRALAETDD